MGKLLKDRFFSRYKANQILRQTEMCASDGSYSLNSVLDEDNGKKQLACLFLLKFLFQFIFVQFSVFFPHKMLRGFYNFLSLLGRLYYEEKKPFEMMEWKFILQNFFDFMDWKVLHCNTLDFHLYCYLFQFRVGVIVLK